MKLKIDILDTNNEKTFGVIDYTQYDKSIKLNNYNIEILIPGFISPVNQPFKKNEINIFNSLNLGLSNVSECKENLQVLPDGLYLIEFSAMDSNLLEKYCTKIAYYRTVFLTSIFEDAYNLATKSCNNDKDKINQLIEIEYLLTGITTNANKGNFDKAESLYIETKKLLEKFLKRC